MSHDYHEGQPGFDPAQILKDGCAECGDRSERLDVAINYLDPVTFAKAWHRATEYGHGELEHASAAEVPLLRALFALQVQFERISGLRPGLLPAPFISSRNALAQAASADTNRAVRLQDFLATVSRDGDAS